MGWRHAGKAKRGTLESGICAVFELDARLAADTYVVAKTAALSASFDG